MFDRDTTRAVKDVLDHARENGFSIATAESCTGGLIAAALTSVAGSSAVVDRGFVTYSNAAKTKMLGVDAGLIARWGAVSEQVARAMAEGALANADANVTVSVTGVAGPGGGTPEKPVGTVHLATAIDGYPTTHLALEIGDPGRDEIRHVSLLAALGLLRQAMTNNVSSA